MNKIKTQQHSNFWFNDIYEEDLKTLGRHKVDDVFQLAAHRRAISNFVNIVTGKNISVEFEERGNNSYTDGETVTIGASLKDKDFDPAVGLALHEGSHIKLTDFDGYRTFQTNLSKELIEKGRRVLGDGEILLVSKIRSLINYIEDRRIDYFIYKTAPGYRGYYEAMYNKYFYSKVVDAALQSKEYRDETWDSYEMRIINLHNKHTDLSALKGLKKIYKLIDFKNISRLKNTGEVLNVAVNVMDEILNHLETSSGKQEQEQDNDPDEDNNKGDNNSSDKNLKPLSENQKKSLKKAIEKQKNFLDGVTKKKKVTKKQTSDLNNVDASGAELKEVGSEDLREWYDKKSSGKVNAVVFKNFNKQFIKSKLMEPFGLRNNRWWKDAFKYRIKSNTEAITKGIQLGTILGTKLKARNEERSINYSRKDSGKIDKRLIAELGFNNSNVFNHIQTESFTDVVLHISVDASGSMHGKKWTKTITSVVAIAKAASMIQGLAITIDFRSATSSDGSSCPSKPAVLFAYDSRKDKFQKIRNLFPYISPRGPATPEGLCFEAMMDQYEATNRDKKTYFLNFSDGWPQFNSGKLHFYRGPARKFTKKQVQKMEQKGITVLSYFITQADLNNIYQSDKDNFVEMYGSGAKFINVENTTSVARTLNQMFLKRGNQ